MIESQNQVLDERRHDFHRIIVALVFQLARNLGTTMDRRIAPYNLTGQQAGLLLHTCVAHGVTPTQLAPLLGTDNAGITRLIDRLEAKGLVTRRTNPADRRTVAVEPTVAGRDLAPQLAPIFREVFAQLLDGFDADELSQVQSFLHRLVQNVEPQE